MKSRNLDDQTFEEIMSVAINKIPHIYPVWTDFNPHDPGITLLELFAWYKEMQQYHLNFFSEHIQRKFLKLLGFLPATAQPAHCHVEFLPTKDSVKFPANTRFISSGGAVFELKKSVSIDSTQLVGVYLLRKMQYLDVTNVLLQQIVGVMPFNSENGTDSQFLLGFSTKGSKDKKLKFWVQIVDDHKVLRNKFTNKFQTPQTIEFEFVGSNQTNAVPIYDSTHMLCQSGCMIFNAPDDWQYTDIDGKCNKGYYLKLKLVQAGCEEAVKIFKINANVALMVQRKTICATTKYTVYNKGISKIKLEESLAINGIILLFAKTEHGLVRVREFEKIQDQEGISLNVNLTNIDILIDASINNNLYCVAFETISVPLLFHNSSGLPGQRVELELDGFEVIINELSLLCDTTMDDGKIMQSIWKYTDDLHSASARDCVFSYDADSLSLVFGNGKNGAIVPAGENAILINGLSLTLASRGNIPAGETLVNQFDGIIVKNTAAYGGCEAETVDDAVQRLVTYLDTPCRCTSAEDYKTIAMATPGLRIAEVEVLPCYDTDNPVKSINVPQVTIVAMPYNAKPRVLADAYFLNQMALHIEKHRTVCTKVEVVPVLYVPINLFIDIKITDDGALDAAREMILHYFSLNCGEKVIGRGVKRIELIERLNQISGVAKVVKVVINAQGAGCIFQDDNEVKIARHAVAYLESLQLEEA